MGRTGAHFVPNFYLEKQTFFILSEGGSISTKHDDPSLKRFNFKRIVCSISAFDLLPSEQI